MTTTQKWQMLVLTAAVSYGSGLMAMENGEKREEVRNLLSCSNELRKSQPIEIAALKRAIELGKEEKKHMHHQGNTPPDFYNSDRYYHLMPIDDTMLSMLRLTK
jgi:hypothetical protein